MVCLFPSNWTFIFRISSVTFVCNDHQQQWEEKIHFRFDPLPNASIHFNHTDRRIWQPIISMRFFFFIEWHFVSALSFISFLSVVVFHLFFCCCSLAAINQCCMLLFLISLHKKCRHFAIGTMTQKHSLNWVRWLKLSIAATNNHKLQTTTNLSTHIRLESD